MTRRDVDANLALIYIIPMLYRNRPGCSPPQDCGLAAFILLFLGVVVTPVAIVLCLAEGRRAEKATFHESFFGETVEYDGHRFIRWKGTGQFSHHPGCPCRTRAESEDGR